jgi:hypothetical protein
MLHNEPLLEDKVKQILHKDAALAKDKGKAPFWATVMESLQDIKDVDLRNQVFMHTVQSMKYALTPLQEATVSGQVAGYNKAMLPTIIRRVMPQVVATKFVATRQLDVPTQIIQTFRLNRKTNRDGIAAGAELFDPQYNQRYPLGQTPATWQGNKAGLDPNYSSQTISGEAGPTGASYSLQHGPLVPGSLIFYGVNVNDPRDTNLLGSDDGAGNVKTAGGATLTTITSFGALNGLNPTVDLTQAAITTALTALATANPGQTYGLQLTYSIALERNKDLSEVSFAMDLIQVSAKARKNFAQISAEAIQDLEAYSDGKLDALKELVTAMTETMALEIDQELTLAMMANAGKFATWDAKYETGMFRGTQADFNETLVHRMNFLANDMAVDYLRGDDFFCMCHPHLYTTLQNTSHFKLAGADHSHAGEYTVGNSDKFGVVDNFTVAKSPYFPQSDKMLLGYTSKDLTKAPYAYFPYVTYLTPPTVDVMSGDMFSTVVGLQQRYDHKPLLDGKYGLGVLNVQNMYY